MICIELNQSNLKKHQRVSKKLFIKVARQVSDVLKVKTIRLVSVAFVSAPEMKKINKVYRGINQVTDVLSFTLDGSEAYGEIILNYAQAKQQAKTMKHSVQDELVFLLVHGLLHVFGYDHAKKSDAERMFSVQTLIVNAISK